MASLVLVGMRGAGKSTMGKIAADCLNREFIDLDEEMESQQGCSCSEVVAKNGWPGFRLIETQVLRNVLRDKPTGAVIACGGGIVESEEARHILALHSAVLLIYRPIEDIEEYLDSKNKTAASERRPAYGESVSDVWLRRKPYFFECCTFVFPLKKGETNWIKVGSEFRAFMRETPPSPSLLVPNVALCSISDQVLASSTKQRIDDITLGFDGVLITGTNSVCHEKFLETIAIAREKCRLPVTLNIVSAFACGLSLQSNVYAVVIDREVGMQFIRSRLLPRTIANGFTKIVVRISLSMKPVTRVSVETVIRESLELFRFMSHRICGVCISNTVFNDAMTTASIFAFTQEYNETFHPGMAVSVCHDSCSGKAIAAAKMLAVGVGPTSLPWEGGRNSMEKLRESCEAFGVDMPDLYVLFGTPIQLSPSPTMHNCGFQQLGLSKVYQLCDTASVDRVESVILSDRFKGASVTIPHKENVGKFCHKLSDSAAQIGAVNTLYRREDGSLDGDNTDWLGIHALLSKSPRLSGKTDISALVVGAGGTAMAACYCVKHMGMKLYVYNRTFAKAEQLASRFSGIALESLESLGDIDVIIGTVPATSGFVMPDPSIFEKYKPVVFDVAYRPRRTKLLNQAAEYKCETYEGIQMLVEQGLCQFKIWTKRDAPREEITQAVYSYYESS